MHKLHTTILLILFLVSCHEDDTFENPPITVQDLHLLGGSSTIYDQSVNAFGFQSPTLDGLDALHFFVGNSFFDQNWVSAPASTLARDGLGPHFNSKSCASCHFKDGRGLPPTPDKNTNGLLLRLSTDNHPTNGPIGDPIYGRQLQHQSIFNLPTQGEIKIDYIEVAGQYPDGTTYSLRKPTYSIINNNYGYVNSATVLSPRIANQMIGLGLLEAIDEQDMLAWADEHDTNDDGISGKVNYVYNHSIDDISIGRFGWKSNQPTLHQQTAAAFNGDLGITTSMFAAENCIDQQQCDTLQHGGKPEITDEDLAKVVLYSASLAVPAQRDYNNSTVQKGQYLFEKIGCMDCHKTNITTGEHPTFNGYSNQVIHPYTDLLLHDMGEGLADNAPEFLATGSEWRTAPLWGVGLFETVNKHTFYLHDGRARNLEEAILWHGGEGSKSQAAYKALHQTEREALITFLKSL